MSGIEAVKLTFHLTRPARKRGGDRYECTLVGEEKPFVLYVPQCISRITMTTSSKLVAKEIEVTFDPK